VWFVVMMVLRQTHRAPRGANSLTSDETMVTRRAKLAYHAPSPRRPARDRQG